MDTHAEGSQITPEQNRTLFSVMAYVGPLVIVSYLMSSKDAFVKYHVKQGLVVFGIEVLVYILAGFFWPLWMFVSLINLLTLVLSILGIVNAVQHRQAPLPLVGHLADRINI